MNTSVASPCLSHVNERLSPKPVSSGTRLLTSACPKSVKSMPCEGLKHRPYLRCTAPCVSRRSPSDGAPCTVPAPARHWEGSHKFSCLDLMSNRPEKAQAKNTTQEETREAQCRERWYENCTTEEHGCLRTHSPRPTHTSGPMGFTWRGTASSVRPGVASKFWFISRASAPKSPCTTARARDGA